MEVSNNNNKLKKETSLRAALALIPYIGGAIIEVGFEHRARVKNQRVIDFFEELQHYFENVNSTDVNNKFINSDRFNDVFEEIINKVSKTDDLKKRTRFKQLLIGTTAPDAKTEQFDLFFDLTSILNEHQILLLKKFYNVKPLIVRLDTQISELDDELNQSKLKEQGLKSKAQQGIIKQNESISAQIKESRNIEKNKIIAENKMKELMRVKRTDLIGVSDEDMNIFVDDLLAKRLIIDITEVQMGKKSYSYDKLIISPLGYHYIDYLTGKTDSNLNSNNQN